MAQESVEQGCSTQSTNLVFSMGIKSGKSLSSIILLHSASLNKLAISSKEGILVNTIVVYFLTRNSIVAIPDIAVI